MSQNYRTRITLPQNLADVLEDMSIKPNGLHGKVVNNEVIETVTYTMDARQIVELCNYVRTKTIIKIQNEINYAIYSTNVVGADYQYNRNIVPYDLITSTKE